jgi:hypothetical protein
MENLLKIQAEILLIPQYLISKQSKDLSYGSRAKLKKYIDIQYNILVFFLGKKLFLYYT